MKAEKSFRPIPLIELSSSIDELYKKYPKNYVGICLEARSNSVNNKSDYKHEVYQKIIKDPDGFFRYGKRIGTVYENFLSVYHIYVSLYKIYRNIPEGISEEVWKNKIISALSAQPYFNLPKDKSLLYSWKISKKANIAIKNAGSLTRAKSLGKDKGVLNEHFFPRKHFLKIELFEIDSHLNFIEFVYLYFTKGGKYHITTKLENSNLENKIDSEMEKGKGYNPLNWEKNYELCGIILDDYE